MTQKSNDTATLAVLKEQVQTVRSSMQNIEGNTEDIKQTLNEIKLNYATNTALKEYKQEAKDLFAQKGDVRDLKRLAWIILGAMVGLAFAIFQERLTS